MSAEGFVARLLEHGTGDTLARDWGAKKECNT